MKMKKLILSAVLFGAIILAAYPASQRSQTQTLINNFLDNFSLIIRNSAADNYSAELNSNFPFTLKQAETPAGPFITDLQQFKKLNTPPRHKLRGFLEFFSLFSYSGISYNIKYSKFVEDWQWKFTWHDQKERFFTFKANRFDSNDFGLNWRHALAGMMYYEFARSNNLSWLQSSLYSIGGSLTWEYVVEWREVISINDNIMTGLGGISLGESWFQLGKYFINSSYPFNRLFSWLNPLMKINGWLDRKQLLSPYFQSYNPQAQDVYFFLGYRHSPTSTSGTGVGNLDVSFNSRIITEPEFGVPGKINEKFTSPIYSQLDFELMYHGQSREELSLTAKIVPFGRFIQNISEDGKGYSFYYGLGSAFETYVKRPVTDYDAEKVPINRPEDFHFENPRDFRDKLGATDIIGPVFDVTYFSSPWHFRLKGEAYLSFGMINALALNKYSIDHSVLGMKTTLTYYGYYYALGPALKYLAEIGYQNIKLQGFLNYVYYYSLQGRDRFQDQIIDDSMIKDSRNDYGFTLQYRIPGTDFSLLGTMEWVKRWGIIHEVQDWSLEKRLYFGLKINL
jgi:hypothetical protein